MMVVKKQTGRREAVAEKNLAALTDSSMELGIRLLAALKATREASQRVRVNGFVRSLLPVEEAQALLDRIEKFKARAVRD